MNLPTNLWEPISFAPGDIRVWKVGPLSLSIQRTSADWRIAEERDEDASLERVQTAVSTDSMPEKVGRWVAQEDQNQIRIKVQLPDRPLIVRPESPITVLPNQTATFYVGIPMWFQVYTDSKDQHILLKETPAVILSNSWFGSSTEGELCYALKTTARLHLNELPLKPYRATCPLQVRNQSDSQLHFERLCLRAMHLRLYRGASQCWTAPTRVTYRGEGEWSRLIYGTQGPSNEENPVLMAEPRVPVTRGVLNRTFDTIRSFAEEQ